MMPYLGFALIIAVAVAANLAFSAFWYAPRIFGNDWMRLSNIKPSHARDFRSMMAYHVFAAAAMAMTLLIILIWARAYSAEAGLVVGVWTGCGLSAMSILIPYLWEGRPARLFMIVAGNNLCNVVLMATLMAHLRGALGL